MTFPRSPTCPACIEMLSLAMFFPVLSSFGPLTRFIIAQGRHFHWMA